jgi:hypothetical protein
MYRGWGGASTFRFAPVVYWTNTGPVFTSKDQSDVTLVLTKPDAENALEDQNISTISNPSLQHTE